MPDTPRNYSRSADFPGGVVNTTKFKAEILASSITTVLNRIETNVDVISVIFNAALTVGEATTLDGDIAGPAGGLIAAHDNASQAADLVEKTTDPGVTDDASEGYIVGSDWINTTTGEQFACVDPANGAAVWKRTTDRTDAEVKTAYEANADTNAFSDAEQTKLTGVEAAADVTDATNVAAAGAVMDGDFSATEGFMRKTGAGAYTAIKSNLNATTDPTVSDDNTAGYAVGSRWNNTTTPEEFVCFDAATGAAVWTSTTATGGGVFGTELSSGASETEVSTTSTTFVQMFRHTTATLPAGDYYISWFFALRTDQKSIVGQCQLDDGTILAQDFNRRAGTDFITTCGGGAVFTLTNATHFIDFDLRDVGDGPSTAFMSKMRVSLWRVS